jgi:hypothetical protein
MINYLRNSVVSLSGISNQALHPSEMAALLVTDIHLEAGTIRIRGEPMKGEDITRHMKRNYKDLFRAVRKDTGQKRLPPWRPRCSGTTHLDKQF